MNNHSPYCTAAAEGTGTGPPYQGYGSLCPVLRSPLSSCCRR
uniref:Uncharacterized protein n=1 Tax=Anguilla anguilla TaxID=7936 RepID=A0A0E9V0K8_ANGAN